MGEKEGTREPTVYDLVESYKNLRGRYDALDFRLDLLTREVAHMRRREGLPRWPFWVGIAVPIVITAAWRLLSLALG